MYVATPFEDCPVCSRRMKCGDVDSRSEWCRCYYYCRSCDYTFIKFVTFKTQSDEVESEEWEDLPDDPHFEKGQLIFFKWCGWEERGRIWQRHVRNSLYHYHIDCPSVRFGKPPTTQKEFTHVQLSMKGTS